MDILQTVFQGLVDLGASVFLPIVITLIGIILGMKPTKAFSAGLTLGVALVGMNHVMSLMTDSVGAAAQAFVQNTGVQLKALDMGWAPALGLCWTWEYAFLMFPVQIGSPCRIRCSWQAFITIRLLIFWTKLFRTA